jgi:hypothetical protein
MATRMQQRRGTASQWTSANPVLNAGEMGWESDSNKFKIGDGTNHWADLDYFIDANSTVNPSFGTSIVFEGATADSYETTLQVTDPTADRTITLPDVTGTVITTGNLSDITNIGVFSSTITMEGSTANDFELTLSAGDPTADRTITFPDATGTVALTSALSSYATLESPTFTGTVSLPNNTISQAMMNDDSVGTNEIGGLAVTTAKIADLNVTEGKLADGAVTNAKVSASAAIAQSKIDGLTTDLGLKAPLAAPAFTGDATAVNLTVSGNLTVNGTTTNINSTNLVVEDKNIVLGDAETPSDTTADGGGITLKGLTDKTFNWVDATDAWTSSEHINLASGKAIYLNGTLETDVAQTLANKTLSSAVATTALTLNATAELRLADTDSTHYVGFKAPGTVTTNRIWTLPAADGSAGQTLSTDGSGVLAWSTPAAGAAFSELMLIGA